MTGKTDMLAMIALMENITAPWDSDGNTVPWAGARVTFSHKGDWYGLAYQAGLGDGEGLWIEGNGAWMLVPRRGSHRVYVVTGQFLDDESGG